MFSDHFLEQWRKDEETPFSGWDFSYLKDRWLSTSPPWDYKTIARDLLSRAKVVLDMGTGGGEFLASLAPLPKETFATESYQPNVEVARQRLVPLGVQVMATDESGQLPFPDGKFSLILNRQSSFKASEVARVLAKDGIFLTQQVGSNNLNDLSDAFETKPQYKDWDLMNTQRQLEKAGLKIQTEQEWQGCLEFKDVGAIVYFLKAIPWIVPHFSVKNNARHLNKLQQTLVSGNKLIFIQTRFLIQAQK